MTRVLAIIRMALIAAFVCTTAARATEAGDPLPAQAQVGVPLFDCYAMNSAWGFTLSGKLIDADGTIYSYGRRGEAWLARPAAEQGASYYTEAALREKFTDARRSGSVDAAVLAEKSKLIEAAGAGKLSIADGGARDAGSSGCHAYVRDTSARRYRDIDLGSDAGVSDQRSVNDAPAAEQLLTWLRSIGVAR
jgi:hypothetical protein